METQSIRLMEGTTSPTPTEAGRLFLEYCRVKNLSPKTIKFYQFQLKRIVDTLEEDNPDIRVNEIGISELRHVVERTLDTASTTTVNHTITTCKTMFQFLADDDYPPYNPALKLDKIKAPKILIKPFNEEQVQVLLAQPNKLRFSGLRDYAMLVLLFDTGLRLSEIISLQTEDIDWKSNTFRVMGKGSKERIVPFGLSCRKILLQYADRRGNQKCPCFFVNELAEPLTTKTLQVAMQRYARKGNITGVRVSPHTCRHTFAVSWIRNGGDIFHLQRILGHSSLEICRHYVNLVTDDLQRAHETHSPMDKMFAGGSSPARDAGPRRRIR